MQVFLARLTGMEQPLSAPLITGPGPARSDTEECRVSRLISDLLATADRLRYADQGMAREVAEAFIAAPPELLLRYYREVRSLFRWLPDDAQRQLRAANPFWRRLPTE